MVEMQAFGAPAGAMVGAPAVDPWEFLNSTGRKSLSWVKKNQFGQDEHFPPGTSRTVRAAELPEVQQQRDFDDNSPKFYPDGKPMLMIKVVCETDPNQVPREDAQDDGLRAVYFRNQSLRALQDEMKRAGVKQFGIGTVFTITLVDLKQGSKGFPQKIFDVKMQPTVLSNPTADQLLAAPQQGQAAPVAQQQFVSPAQPAFPGQVVPAPAQFVQPQAPQFSAAPAQAPAGPPVQQFPAQVAGAAAALAAGYTEVAPQAAAAAPSASPIVTQEHLEQVNLLMRNGFAREAAIAAVANQDPALFAAIEANVPF